jgi:hypothetical protein
MRQAVFITGFNNWGKSTIIFDLFNRSRFFNGWTYPINRAPFNTLFTVQTQSNDDLWGQAYVTRVIERIEFATDRGENLFSALCPSMENTNNFVSILSAHPFTTYDRLHIFLIEFKWEHHARLIIDNIRQSGQGIPNVNFIVIEADRDLANDDDRYNAKIAQIRAELNNIFIP